MKEAGFETDVRRETSDTVDKGRVISTSPQENSQLEKGRTVVLVVSEGREKVSVPDVVGKKEAAERTVSIRRLGSEGQQIMPLDQALAMLADEALPPDLRRTRLSKAA